MHEPPHQPGQLKRQLGLFHAVMLGLGSILGTGVFVSIGIAAGFAGPSVLIAIVLAAVLALCNGLSSAQLAAAHPVAGGTYEYGYKYLGPKLGFTAGWMFLLAKSASAATAALGAAGYLNTQFIRIAIMEEPDVWHLYKYMLCVGATSVIVLLVLIGVRKSAWVNSLLVLVSLSGLAAYCVYIGINYQEVLANRGDPIQDDIVVTNGNAVLAATALLFVAYTGYGRLATLGEEVRSPRSTIPKAIVFTLVVTLVIYLCVGAALVIAHDQLSLYMFEDWIVGSYLIHGVWASGGSEWLLSWIALSAITAMLGVLLNLVLGLSRVLLAMGRRRDVPGVFAKVNDAGTTPVPAVLGVGVLIAGLTLIGDIKTTWSFSAFTVLIYYGITNLAALRLPAENRLYPRVFAWAGLGGCLFLAWWVEPVVWMAGTALIMAGLIWHALAPRMFGAPPPPGERCVACGYDLRASAGACPECGTPIDRAGANH